MPKKKNRCFWELIFWTISVDFITFKLLKNFEKFVGKIYKGDFKDRKMNLNQCIFLGAECDKDIKIRNF